MLNQKIIDIIGCRSRTGEFGLELEVEGTRLPMTGLSPYWVVHQDGSLRGEAAEYVLQNPLAFNETKAALKFLDGKFQASKSTFDLSSRTSVHVHLNCQKALLQEVYTLICVAFIVENLMVEFSGPDRIGNLFCLRAQDAEYLPIQVAQNLKSGRYLGFLNDNIRYASLNLLALQTYGSLEFRSFRGSVNQDEIIRWIEIINCVKVASKKYNDPRVLLKDLYDNGPLAFLRSIFPEEIVEVFTSYRNWRSSIERGSHYAFEIAYATNEWCDKEAVHKSYKDRKKTRPGECEDPQSDPRFIDMEPEYVEAFLYYERDNGEVIPMTSRHYQEYVRAAQRRVEGQRAAQRRQEENNERARMQAAQAAINAQVQRPPVARVPFPDNPPPQLFPADPFNMQHMPARNDVLYHPMPMPAPAPRDPWAIVDDFAEVVAERYVEEDEEEEV